MADVGRSTAGLPRAARIAAWCGAAVGLATVGLYGVVMYSQDDDAAAPALVWAAVMLLPCAMTLVATWTAPRTAALLLGASAALLGALGLLAIFSIGLGFLLAALLVLVAALIAIASSSGARGPA